MDDTSELRIALVERHKLLRDAYRALLESRELKVVGEVSDPAEVVPMVDGSRPDAVLVFLDGTGQRDIALLNLLPEIAGKTNALIISVEMDAWLHAQAIELGARGILLTHQPGTVLDKAVKRICAGELWLDRAQIAGVVTRLRRSRANDDPELAKIESLTRREREIVKLVTEGLTNKDIAERLFITQATARNHLTSILDKLDLTDRFQLTVYAFRRGLVLCRHTPGMLRMAAKMAETGQVLHPVAIKTRQSG
jgi:DNA-binding NarL/FixJ family response regulator